MSKTVLLRSLIKNELNKITNNVFYEMAYSDKSYPYIVFNISETGGRMQLEINVYDRNQSGDTKAVDTLADDVDVLFKNYYHADDNQTLIINLNIRSTVFETDKATKRRRLLFDLKYFGKD